MNRVILADAANCGEIVSINDAQRLELLDEKHGYVCDVQCELEHSDDRNISMSMHDDFA